MPPLSVNIITKDSPESTLRCVESVMKTIFEEGDEILVLDTGSSSENLLKLRTALKDIPGCAVLTAPEEAFVGDQSEWIEKYCPEHFENFKKHYPDGKVMRSFADARNYVLERSKHNLIFWIDADDVIEEPANQAGKLRATVNDTLNGEGDIDAIFMEYLYNFEEDGEPNTILRRERFFYKDRWHWKGHCHEVATPRPGQPYRKVAYFEELQAVVKHTEARKPLGVSDLRNYVILRKQYEAEKEDQDPRTIFYYGNGARGLRYFDEAHRLYDEFTRVSGSVDDRWAAHYYKANMYLDPAVMRPVDAFDQFMKCIEIKPTDPRGYYGVSRCWAALEHHEEAIQWFEHGRRMPFRRDQQVFSWDPLHVDFHPLGIAAIAAKELGDIEAACKYAIQQCQRRPTAAKEIMEQWTQIKAGAKLKEALLIALQNMKYQGPPAYDAAKAVVQKLGAVPKEVEEDLGLSHIEPRDVRPPRPSIAIFCGRTLEEWGPHSRILGTGGSEKMVILLSEHLQKLGWNVTVYASVPPPFRGIHGETRVNWRHWAEFDVSIPRDVFIAWRSPELVCMRNLRAKVRVVWLHDVQSGAKGRYPSQVLELLDGANFQSKFHIATAKDVVPPVKHWLARNAIETKMPEEGWAHKNPKLVVFNSSWDRGIHTAARIVLAAQQIDPEIRLVTTYGITPFARKRYKEIGMHGMIFDVGHEMGFLEYEREVNAILDLANATRLGRVGFDRMYQTLIRAGVWLYPTRFPEISCMAAMENQAFGAIPLAPRFGALEETILPEAALLADPLPQLERGEASLKYIQYAADRLVEATKIAADHPQRKEMSAAAWDAFNIEDLAKTWDSWLRKRV